MLWTAIGIMCVDALALGLAIAGGVYVISLIYRVVQAARHMHRLEREYVEAERERLAAPVEGRNHWRLWTGQEPVEPIAPNVGGMGWDDEAT